MTPRSKAEGFAAVEFAIFFGLFFVLLTLALPLGTSLVEQLRLERAAAAANRFATQSPDRVHPGVAAGERRPTCAEIVTDARADALAQGIATPIAVTVAAAYFDSTGLRQYKTCVSPAGSSVVTDGTTDAGHPNGIPDYGPGVNKQIVLSEAHSLLVFAGLASAAGIPNTPSITLTATSVGRQE